MGEIMIDSISKPKPPRGQAYVLKTSLLKDALEDAGIDCHVDLKYWVPQGGGSILEAHYWLANENVPYPRVYIRAGVVPLDQRGSAMEALANKVLPAFVRWLTQIVELPDNSPKLHDTLYFNATFNDAGLQMSDSPEYKIPRSHRK